MSDLNMLKAQYFENSWSGECYLATIADYRLDKCKNGTMTHRKLVITLLQHTT